jgi:hypothetical protein
MALFCPEWTWVELFCPGGTSEISRWREPPDPVVYDFRPGRGGGSF